MILSQKCALVQEIQLGSPDHFSMGSGDKTMLLYHPYLCCIFFGIPSFYDLKCCDFDFRVYAVEVIKPTLFTQCNHVLPGILNGWCKNILRT